MYTQLLACLSADNASLETWLDTVPNSVENIDLYREKKLALLSGIYPIAISEQTDASILPVLKLGAEIVSDIVRTRIIQSTGDGFLITAPCPVASSTRTACRKIYDTLLNRITSVERMYIAPSFESDFPGTEKRLAAMRLYDMHDQENRTKSQSSNKTINRLFGSRG